MMLAAREASDDTVSLLLAMGASPNQTNANGNTALIFAIQSMCLTTINLLAPLTQANLGKALQQLARDKIDPTTGELRRLVERAAHDMDAVIGGLTAAVTHGCSDLILLIGQYTRDESILEIFNSFKNKEDIWMDAISTDSEATVSTLLHLLPNPPLEAITLARERGVPGKERKARCLNKIEHK